MSSLSISETLRILRAAFRAGDNFIAEYLKEEENESRDAFRKSLKDYRDSLINSGKPGNTGGEIDGKMASTYGNDNDKHEHSVKRKSDLQ